MSREKQTGRQTDRQSEREKGGRAIQKILSLVCISKGPTIFLNNVTNWRPTAQIHEPMWDIFSFKPNRVGDL